MTGLISRLKCAVFLQRWRRIPAEFLKKNFHVFSQIAIIYGPFKRNFFFIYFQNKD